MKLEWKEQNPLYLTLPKLFSEFNNYSLEIEDIEKCPICGTAERNFKLVNGKKNS
jgi:hypothetical protein